MLVHWIWLATRPGLNDWQKRMVLEAFSGPEDAFYADREDYRKFEWMTQEGFLSLQDKNLTQAQEILQECMDKHIQICTFQDASYPQRLKNISDPPLVLYYKGRIPEFDACPVIAAVGTRKASPYGLGVAKRMGYQIASCGGILVSGLAFGIDGMAMRGALTAGGCVVGVLGCGADVVYPASNRALFADTEQNGCLLTEFPPGTPPVKWNFPKRNRIISGLSCGVLVVEAPEKSGALITAKQAADQGRDVFVIPGNVDVSSCIGSNALLREGAIAVSTGWEVVSEYKALFPDKIRENNAGAQHLMDVQADIPPMELKVAQKPAAPQKTHKKGKPVKPKEAKPDIEALLQKLSPQEQKIIALLRGGAQLVDTVIDQSGLPAGKVLAMLTFMEIKGIVVRMPGKQVALKY